MKHRERPVGIVAAGRRGYNRKNDLSRSGTRKVTRAAVPTRANALRFEIPSIWNTGSGSSVFLVGRRNSWVESHVKTGDRVPSTVGRMRLLLDRAARIWSRMDGSILPRAESYCFAGIVRSRDPGPRTIQPLAKDRDSACRARHSTDLLPHDFASHLDHG